MQHATVKVSGMTRKGRPILPSSSTARQGQANGRACRAIAASYIIATPPPPGDRRDRPQKGPRQWPQPGRVPAPTSRPATLLMSGNAEEKRPQPIIQGDRTELLVHEDPQPLTSNLNAGFAQPSPRKTHLQSNRANQRTATKKKRSRSHNRNLDRSRHIVIS
jgi:hypothetical protein